MNTLQFLVFIIIFNVYFTSFYVKHFELPPCMKLSCINKLALPWKETTDFFITHTSWILVFILYIDRFKSLGSVIFFLYFWKSLLLTKAGFIWSILLWYCRTIYSKTVLLLQFKMPVLCLKIWKHLIYFCDYKAEFSASLLQSSVSYDPSEIICICWCKKHIKISCAA